MQHQNRLKGFGLLALVLPFVSGVGCAADASDGEADVSSVGERVANGDLRHPWAPGGGPEMAKAIVDLSGCTGTIIDPSWVLSARHCGFGVGRIVTNVRPSGNVYRTVDRVVGAPTEMGSDAVLLHVSEAWPDDVPLVPLYEGPTSALVGQSVECFGYGARGAHNKCSSQSDCSSGDYCAGLPEDGSFQGTCLAPGDGELRSGVMAVTSQADGFFNTAKNAQGQFILPGDSGGPCFFGAQGVAGINAAWYYDLSGGVQTSVSDSKIFIHRTIKPYVRGDFDGDGRADTAYFQPGNGRWRVWELDGGQTNIRWGENGDVPVVGDYDGDGLADRAIYRPSTGTFWVLRSSDGSDFTQQQGAANFDPVPGDYDGDGITDFAVRRRSNSQYYVISSITGVETMTPFGRKGDIAVPGDYDYDGKNDFAVWRPSNGTFIARHSSDGSEEQRVWGEAGDVPIPGDYDGDGKTDFAVWRPSNGRWYILRSSDGTDSAQVWGTNGDIPVPADYDGDGRTDAAIYRPSENKWIITRSHAGSAFWRAWGASDAIPVTRAGL